MSDTPMMEGKRTLGVIDETLTQISLGIVGLLPTLSVVLVWPKALRGQIDAASKTGRNGILLAPGPFFIIGLFSSLIAASFLARGADGAMISIGQDVASAASDGQFWRAASVALPLFLGALLLGILFFASAQAWRLSRRTLKRNLRAAQYGLLGLLSVVSVSEPLSNLTGLGGSNGVFEPAVFACIGLWLAFFHFHSLTSSTEPLWKRLGASLTVALGVSVLMLGAYVS